MILKDRVGIAQHLLIAIQPIVGIEDARLLDSTAPRYWNLAWQARRYVVDRLGRPLAATSLSLAVNSAYGRTQKRLHVHIDCVAPDVRAAIASQVARIDDRWSPFPIALAGHRYRVRWVAALDRAETDPFLLVARDLPGARAHMDRESILVVDGISMRGEQGFVVFETRAGEGEGNRGSAEELQDHGCAIANDAP